ncbi:MAG: hypothetical protein DMG50_19465 [Acidobacteria bacterium]|nr:MAG: hypothetical protein DMG50_19465 [Acidobacteriota bacterium]
MRISGGLPARAWRNEKFAEFDSPLMREGLAPSPIQKIVSLCSVNSFEKAAIPCNSHSIPSTHT